MLRPRRGGGIVFEAAWRRVARWWRVRDFTLELALTDIEEARGPERCPGGACGCRPGQGGEEGGRVTLLAFRSRPREAGHICMRARGRLFSNH
jgi:hypothetical protein